MKFWNRRQFLMLSASTAGVIVLARCANGQTQLQPDRSRRPVTTHKFTSYTSTNGGLDVALDARHGSVSLAGQSVDLLSYNGQIPGPLLEAKPGDTVRIRFTNRLPEPTNLHFHGLHIPPTGTADNIFLNIAQGETFTYDFTIPDDHPGGTFFYHPHRHGFVADQVFGGLGGLFVIRGALDDIPEIQAASEVFVFLKDFALDASGTVFQPWHMEQMWGREGPLLTVNGQVNTKLSIPSGGLMRLRLVNASNARFYRLSLQQHSLYLIATDGNPLAQLVELQELLLAPGERADVLVRGERQSGQYQLLNLPYNRGEMGMMGPRMGRGPMGPGMGHGPMGPGMGPGGVRSSEVDRPTPLVTLMYQGQIDPLPLPQQLVTIDTLPETQTLRRFTLDHAMAHGMGMVFLINNKAFDPQRIDTRVLLNTVEDWEIINQGVMDHPFHLHTNPFQVISRNGSPVPYRAWKDTVLVPVGESVRIRVRFKDFTGKTVYHCHILDHEDLGMMGVIEIQS